MPDIKELFGGANKGLPMGKPPQANLKLDINTLPDIACIKCGEKEFNNITRIKKLSRTVSPTGQEGNVNVNMLKCSKCGWLFSPKEYEDYHNNKDQKETPKIEQPKVKEIKKVEDETKVLCRKCGEFYEKNKNHECK